MTNMNVPKLRFEEFTDEWEIKSLKSITDRLTRKNKNLETNNPLTISAQQGLISQTDFFNKVIASDNLKDYYLLKKGEFAYNKSYSNEYPYGAIKRLDLYNEGAISTLYICFTVNDYVDSDFLTIYFESDKWYKEIYKIAVEGARNHGLLNIGVNDFFNTKHNIPSLDEQKKISSFLMAVDKKLKLLNDKKTNFLKFKKYLLQNMFPQNDEKTPKLRFTKYNDEWNTVKLGDLMEKGKAGGTPTSSNKDYYGGTIPFLSINDMTSQGKYITYTSKLITQKGLENSSAWILPKNSLLYSIYASVGFVGINLINMATSQAIYGIILKKEVNIQYLYYYLLNFKRNLHKYIETGTQGNINAKILKNFKINIPSLDEQGKIASFLSSVDKKIDLLDQEIEYVEEYKKGLLQKMFC